MILPRATTKVLKCVSVHYCMAEPIAQIQAQLDAANAQLASTNEAGASSAQDATNTLVARSVELAEVGGSPRISARSTLNRQKIAIELFRASA